MAHRKLRQRNEDRQCGPLLAPPCAWGDCALAHASGVVAGLAQTFRPRRACDQLWVLRSTLKDEATDTTLAPGEGMSSDHTFLLRHQQRAIVIHVTLSYQLSPPLDVGSLDLSPGRTGTVESLSVATTG